VRPEERRQRTLDAAAAAAGAMKTRRYQTAPVLPLVGQFECTRRPYFWSLCSNTTSSIKPEVHDISQRRHRRPASYGHSRLDAAAAAAVAVMKARE